MTEKNSNLKKQNSTSIILPILSLAISCITLGFSSQANMTSIAANNIALEANNKAEIGNSYSKKANSLTILAALGDKEGINYELLSNTSITFSDDSVQLSNENQIMLSGIDIYVFASGLTPDTNSSSPPTKIEVEHSRIPVIFKFSLPYVPACTNVELDGRIIGSGLYNDGIRVNYQGHEHHLFNMGNSSSEQKLIETKEIAVFYKGWSKGIKNSNPIIQMSGEAESNIDTRIIHAYTADSTADADGFNWDSTEIIQRTIDVTAHPMRRNSYDMYPVYEGTPNIEDIDNC